MPRPAMKVTLISTVKDCADAAGAFLASLATQTRAPDEVVIVDGGSSDGTADAFAGEGVTMLVEVGANISRGRNVALAAATHEVIAATDGSDAALAAVHRAVAMLRPGAHVSVVMVIAAEEDPMADAGGFEGPLITEDHDNYAGYQKKTDREIPVVLLEPRS